jgi:predicted Zn finger-like uncharacterized protein
MGGPIRTVRRYPLRLEIASRRAGGVTVRAPKPDMVSDPLTHRLLGSGLPIGGERPMQIVCPHCETSYDIDPSAVGPTGRSVRCARCRSVWFAANADALTEIAASHRAEMEQFAVAGPEPEGVVESPVPAEEPAAPEPPDAGLVPDAPSIAVDSQAADPPAAIDAPLIESPALAPVEPEPAAPPLAEDIETVAARRALEQARNRRFWPRVPGLPTLILALVVLDLGLIGWRAEIVRLLPQTASLYAAVGLGVNLRGLVLTDVTSETQTAESVQVLLVHGRIVSTAKHVIDVPRLRFAVRNGSGNEIYSWTALPARSLLAPGETLAFESRLASPPPETHDVLVRFFNRRDRAVGIQ